MCAVNSRGYGSDCTTFPPHDNIHAVHEGRGAERPLPHSTCINAIQFQISALRFYFNRVTAAGDVSIKITCYAT